MTQTIQESIDILLAQDNLTDEDYELLNILQTYEIPEITEKRSRIAVHQIYAKPKTPLILIPD